MFTARSRLLTSCLLVLPALSGCEATGLPRNPTPFQRAQKSGFVADQHVRVSATGETDSSVWLSTEQLDALAADPSELLLDLQMIAGVGSIVRVDGVDGGTAPPKAAIAAIHITRIGIAGGEVLTVIDVMTKSG